MLDYNIEILAGPRSHELKTANNAELGFNPRALLPEIVDIYLRLGNSPAFIEAVAADGRSYKPEVFAASSRIIASRNLKDPAAQEAWLALQQKFVQAKEILDQAEADFGTDLPPEFEDPIMGDIMSDPVILPSKHVVDRSTIVQHLLSDPKDPYTRQPMTEDDVVPHDELRKQIEAWKAEKLAARKARTVEAVAEALNSGPAEAMDTSEG
jgi:ubiquitin conjugation factor E4 B